MFFLKIKKSPTLHERRASFCFSKDVFISFPQSSRQWIFDAGPIPISVMSHNNTDTLWDISQRKWLSITWFLSHFDWNIFDFVAKCSCPLECKRDQEALPKKSMLFPHTIYVRQRNIVWNMDSWDSTMNICIKSTDICKDVQGNNWEWYWMPQ